MDVLMDSMDVWNDVGIDGWMYVLYGSLDILLSFDVCLCCVQSFAKV